MKLNYLSLAGALLLTVAPLPLNAAGLFLFKPADLANYDGVWPKTKAQAEPDELQTLIEKDPPVSENPAPGVPQPNPITGKLVEFEDQYDLDFNIEVISKEEIVMNLSSPLEVYLEQGQVSINNGPWVSSGTIRQGDRVRLKTLTPNAPEFFKTIRVVSEYGDFNWTIGTRRAHDPAAFDFMDMLSMRSGDRVVYSNTVYFNDLEAPMPMAIEKIDNIGSEPGPDVIGLSINGRNYSPSDEMMVNPEDYVYIRSSAGLNFGSESVWRISVGGMSDEMRLRVEEQNLDPLATDGAFGSYKDAEPGAVVTSQPYRFFGMTGSVPLEMVNGEFSLDYGKTWHSALDVYFGVYQKTLEYNIQVRTQAPLTLGESKIATLKIGNGSFDFTVTSVEEDLDPDPFSFQDRVLVANGTWIESGEVVITGINSNAPLSITGGEYSINGGAWSSAETTVREGDSVNVRARSSSELATKTSAILTVGGLSDEFSVMTAPEAETAMGVLDKTSNITFRYHNRVAGAPSGGVIVVGDTGTATAIAYFDKDLGLIASKEILETYNIGTVTATGDRIILGGSVENKNGDTAAFVMALDYNLNVIKTQEFWDYDGYNSLIEAVKPYGAGYLALRKKTIYRAKWTTNGVVGNKIPYDSLIFLDSNLNVSGTRQPLISQYDGVSISGNGISVGASGGLTLDVSGAKLVVTTTSNSAYANVHYTNHVMKINSDLVSANYSRYSMKHGFASVATKPLPNGNTLISGYWSDGRLALLDQDLQLIKAVEVEDMAFEAVTLTGSGRLFAIARTYNDASAKGVALVEINPGNLSIISAKIIDFQGIDSGVSFGADIDPYGYNGVILLYTLTSKDSVIIALDNPDDLKSATPFTVRPINPRVTNLAMDTYGPYRKTLNMNAGVASVQDPYRSPVSQEYLPSFSVKVINP